MQSASTNKPIAGSELKISEQKSITDTSLIDEQVDHFMYTIHKTQNKSEGTRLGTYFLSSKDKKKGKNIMKIMMFLKIYLLLNLLLKILIKMNFMIFL